MATWSDWQRLFVEKQELKRCYFFCGPHRFLIEEMIDQLRERVSPHDLDYSMLDASALPARDVWMHANQYPLDPTRHRLVIVREAERLSSWKPLESWLLSRLIPQNIVAFVSGRPDEDTSQAHMQRIIKSGRFLRCRLSDEEAPRYLSARLGLDMGEARGLLQSAGSVERAREAGLKALQLLGSADVRVATKLLVPTPSENFVGLLLAMRKADAAEAAEELDPSELSRVIGELDYRLDALGRINRAARTARTVREIAAKARLDTWLVKELAGSAKHYDPSSVRRRSEVLAIIDGQFRTDATGVRHGPPVGALEALTALW